RLGRLQDILRWFAIVRHSTPWLGPRQGGNHFEVDKPALLVAFLLADGTHLVICPEHGKPDITTSLEDDGAGNIVVRSRNDAETRATVRIILSAGNEFELTLADAVRNSRLGSPGPPASAKVDKEALEDWYDGFSYCTWNGLGRELDEEKIQQALSTLSQHGLVVPNLIIDDNWQSLDNIDNGDPFTYRWTDFEANKENFPRGLKHTITNIRASHTHLRHVAVWHGIFGYWGGFSPDGNIAKCYATQEVQKQNQESYMKGDTATVVSAKDAHTMYDDFYRFLAECGIDSVKADNGFYPDYIQGAQDRRELIYTYQDAFLQASETHFGHRAISCMSQTPQNLFYSFMDDGKRPRYLVRNSDDFFPDAPESHTWHIFCNAHNSVLTQHLNILPDWDMFQTAGPNPYMHAAARCLSGGPIYITDKPGEHDIRLIHQMTTLGLDGRHRILRPEIIGRATEVYNKPQSRRFLRIAAGHLDTCFLGLFNMSDRESVELVTLRAITRSESHGSYIVLKHYDKCRKVHHLSSIHDVVSVKLSPSGGHEILTAYPISTAGTFDFAILGLTGHMTGAAVL
ncbi:glycoside hydrolase family 36 protein, partial [Myriangium duriaei CBS 260.36]